MYTLLFVVSLLATGYGHMCLLSPYQRGGVNDTELSKPGSMTCGRTTGMYLHTNIV